MKKKIAILSASAICLSALTTMPHTAFAEDTTYFSSSFENGDDSWSGRGSASVEVNSSVAYQGSKSLYVTGRAEAWNGAIKALSSDFSAGNAYSFSANVRFDKGKGNTDTFFMKIQYDDASGQTAYDGIAEATAFKGDWVQLANTNYTIPSDASNISVYIETESSTNSFYLDDVTGASAGTVIKGAGGSGELILGDANGDGQINAPDLALAKQGVLAGEFKSYRAEFASDVNQSGTVTIADVVWIQKYIICGETAYPEKAEPENPIQGGSDGFQYNANLQYHAIPNNYWNEPSDGGKLTKESYNCGNGTNNCWVYTPAGYSDSQQYNIFYLMHGGGENENTLFFQDDTNLKPVLDNMIKNGEIQPMIVVTPTFNKCSAETFYQEFRKYLVPYIEGKYSTYAKSTSAEDITASRMHRAYGGFSMGSVSTWAVMKNDLDMVGYFMPLSGDHWPAGIQNATAQQKANEIASAIDQGGYGQGDYFIFAATGTNDIAYPNENPQIEAMKTMPQFTYTSDFSVGNLYFLLCPGADHWWGNVRHYVYDGLPYFFHENQ